MSEPYSAEWYREFAEKYRHSEKNISLYYYYLGIAEAIELTQAQGKQRERVKELEDALNRMFHDTDCTTGQMEIIEVVSPQNYEKEEDTP